MNPDQYCRDKVAGSGSSFYYGFLFLAPAKRRAITAFYAYCREVDDIVDECREPLVARAKLAWWRQEIQAIYGGGANHPVARALAEVVGPFGIPQAQLEEILDGMAMDLDQARYPDFPSLRLYCHRVAGLVGEIAARIFGYTDPATLQYAARLGLALQLTNIIRDVGEDARRGRIYLPQDELRRFGVGEDQLLRSQGGTPPPEHFLELMEFQYRRAQATYDEAYALLPPCDRRVQRPGLIMAAIYRTLLAEIRRDGYPVLHSRLSLPAGRKLWLATKTWLTG